MRGDFTARTKDTLAKRVGYRCSNPNCRLPTSGPQDDPAKAVNVGEAAHIVAATQDGPRGDSPFTLEQRRQLDNGIWLCSKCHQLVDSDWKYYTADMLRAWKTEAEQYQRDVLQGKIRPAFTPPTPAAPYQAPRPLDQFVGRTAELDRLDDILKPGAKTAITGLVGMGGLGKTELAKLAASHVADRFRDGILWADCAELNLVSIADLWAGAYGIQLPGDDPPSKSAAWRGLISAKEALLIFDNLQPGQDLEPLFPPSGRSAVLITTRQHTHPDLRGAGRLDLDHFTLDEATDLAAEILGEDQARDQATDTTHIFELLGYLPLAISVALHLAAKCRWSLATLHTKLKAARALAVLGDEEALRKSLNATFQTAWANLPDDLQEPFRTLSLFNQGPSFSTQALAATLDLDPDDAGALLHRLAGRSLLTVETETRWSLHPLLREFVATLEPPGYAARLRFARHYEQAAREANHLYKQGGDNILQALALFDLEWPHIRAGQAWAAAHVEDGDQAARLCIDYPDAGWMYLRFRLHPRDRIAWAEPALQAARRLGDLRAEVQDLRALGVAYADLGQNREAIERYNAALRIACQIGSRHDEGAILGNLGLAYARLGETHKAIDYFQQLLEIARKIGSRRSEGAALGNLGLAYATLGETHKAFDHYQQALEMSHELGDRHGEGNHLGNLGNVYADLGETHQAIDCYQQALEISCVIGDRRMQGNSLGNLGLAYADLGETRQAIDYYQRALDISREIGNRRGVGNHLTNLGLTYGDLGELDRARDYWTQALAIYEDISDPNAQRVRQWLADLEH